MPQVVRRDPDGLGGRLKDPTVRNAAAFVTPSQVALRVGVPGTWKATASGCTLAPDGTMPIECTLPAIAKHSSRTVSLTLTAPTGNLDARCQLWVASVTPDGGDYPDVNPDKGATKVAVTKA